VYDRTVRFTFDRSNLRASREVDIIPKKYLTRVDSSRGNFSGFYSCNRVALVKLIYNLVGAAKSAGLIPHPGAIRRLLKRAYLATSRAR